MATSNEYIRTTEELGKLLRAYRKSRRLTQASAAALAGVGERFLSELERGKATAEIGLVLKVIDRLGLTLMVARRDGSAFFIDDQPAEQT